MVTRRSGNPPWTPIGTIGQLPTGEVLLVENVVDVDKIKPRDEEKLAYITQTTLSIDDTLEIATALKKRFPLAISRGVHGDSFNVFVRVEKEGIVGWGESAPGKNEGAQTPEIVISELSKLIQTEIENKSILLNINSTPLLNW